MPGLRISLVRKRAFRNQILQGTIRWSQDIHYPEYFEAFALFPGRNLLQWILSYSR